MSTVRPDPGGDFVREVVVDRSRLERHRVEQVSCDECAPVVETRRFLRDPRAVLAGLLGTGGDER